MSTSRSTYTFHSMIRGYDHVYQDILAPTIGKQISCRKDRHNVHDMYAVAVVDGDSVVGHVPRTISATCYLFITRGGNITCEISGNRRYCADLPQSGLELPYKLTFSGSTKDISKTENLLNKAPSLPASWIGQS